MQARRIHGPARAVRGDRARAPRYRDCRRAGLYACSDFFYWHSASVRAAPTSSHNERAPRGSPRPAAPLQVELLQLLEQLLARVERQRRHLALGARHHAVARHLDRVDQVAVARKRPDQLKLAGRGHVRGRRHPEWARQVVAWRRPAARVAASLRTSRRRLGIVGKAQHVRVLKHGELVRGAPAARAVGCACRFSRQEGRERGERGVGESCTRARARRRLGWVGASAHFSGRK